MKYLKPALTAILPTMLVVAIGEVAARATGSFGEDDTAEDPGMINSASLGWDRQPDYKGIVTGSYREFDSNGLDRRDSLELANLSGPRVLFLGGSVTFGSGLDVDSTFASLVRQNGVRSVNAGMIGYSSFQGRVLLSRLEPLVQPDIIVADFGIHDRVAAHPSRVDGPDTFRRRHPGILTVTLFRSHAIRALRSGLVGVGIIRGESCLPIDSMVPRVPPDAFRENLTAMAELASRRQSRLILLNIGEAPWIRRELSAARTLLSRAQWDSAVKRLAPIAAGEPEFYCCVLLARRMLSEALRQQGLVDSANTMDCVNERLAPMVQDVEYVQIMREVAAATGAKMVDAQEMMTDSVLFVDDNHLSVTGHRRLASILAPLLLQESHSTSAVREAARGSKQ